MNINKIEEKLLNDKIKEFDDQVNKGIDLIINAFKQYHNFSQNEMHGRLHQGIKGDLKSSINDYLKSKITARSGYYCGDYTYVSQGNGEIPEGLKKLMLERAVNEFFEKIDYVNEVVEGLE